MKFAIFGNTYQAKKSSHAENLFRLLAQHQAQLCVCREVYNFLTSDLHLNIPPAELFDGDDFRADMVISIGGDGTFLKAASRVGKKNIPILGINTGRLGFLADISPEEMEETIDEIYNNHYKVEERSVLQLKCDDEKLMEYPYALNEIAVLKRDSSSMISIHTAINGAHLTTYQADGLVIATPTGSTAYSLSVGGPVIVPHSKTIAITPVAPHSLNVRPIVICDDWEITLDVESRSHNFLVAVDGLIWMGDFDTMLSRIEEKMAAGFRCIKLKIGAIGFEDELALLRHIRAHFSSREIELRVDANGAFSPADAMEKLKRLSELELHSIEQPIRAGQWEEMARLAADSPLPIALDEELIGCNTPEGKRKLLSAINPQYIVLKPSLHGGICGGNEWIAEAEKRHIGWWITSALESNIGLNAIAQWCATFDNPLPQGLGTGLLFTDNVEMPLEVRKDCLWFCNDDI